MPADYLHGVETIEINKGPRPVRAAKTAVIGLVGTAPIHLVATGDQKVNVNVLSLNDVADAKYFGPNLAGYSIPQALEQIRAEGGGTVIVVNVFDPSVHKTAVAAADIDIVDGQIQLAHADIVAITVKEDGGSGAAKVEGTDYTIDRKTGLLTVLDGGSLDGDAQANIAYSYGNPAAVDADDVTGGVGGSGERTGAQALRDAFSQFGYFPKILIAPGYSSDATVMAALNQLAAANRCRAVALVDAPVGTTFDEAIEGRGPDGEINFNVSSQRVIPLFPHVKIGSALASYSASMAGLMCRNDVENGFWFSPSNKELKSITGLELPVSASLNDPDCEANQLNAVGVVTVFNAFGSGYRTWGNRSSAFPSDTTVLAQIAGRRVADQVHESLEMGMLPYMDLPITPALIGGILGSANAYIRTLIGRGALPQGSRAEFNDSKNPPEEVAAGHLTIDLVGHPNPAAERITFESFMLDVSLLQSLGSAA
jgi:phage tail sheath protein FI